MQYGSEQGLYTQDVLPNPTVDPIEQTEQVRRVPLMEHVVQLAIPTLHATHEDPEM